MVTRVQDLPLEEKVKLVEDLWDSIAADSEKLPLTSAQRQELDRRLDRFEVDGNLGTSADSVLAEIRLAL